MTAERSLPRLNTDSTDPISDPHSDETARGQVHVNHGIYSHTLPLAGLTVRCARNELGERLNIAPDAAAFVNGREADEETLLAEGQVLQFVKHAGEKGARRMVSLIPPCV